MQKTKTNNLIQESCVRLTVVEENYPIRIALHTISTFCFSDAFLIMLYFINERKSHNLFILLHHL